MMKVSEFAANLGSMLKSCARIALQARPTVRPKRAAKTGDSIIVLGNGPSLRQTIADHAALLRAMPTVAVNFMANTPEFQEIRPDYYVVADPLFFDGLGNANIAAMWESLRAVTWPMTLCVPARCRRRAAALLGDSRVGLATFNFIGAEGFGWFESLAYRTGLAMPRPRNVLIPAIMTAIAAGYHEIYVVGADHSWLETLRVNERNNVVSVQPHFYADSKAELERSEAQYRGIRLHQLLDSFRIAFRSYHTLRRYADRRGIRIFNATPGSYIDAFERKPLA